MHTLSLLHLGRTAEDCVRVAAALQDGARGYRVQTTSGSEINWLQCSLRTAIPDLVLLDIADDASPAQLLLNITRNYPQVVLVVRASHDDPQLITTCLRSGADDFLSRSCAAAEIGKRLVHVWLCRRAATARSFPYAVGATMQTVAAQLLKVLHSAVAAVHVQGESGTGKEVVASIVRDIIAPRPLVTINCAAIPPALIGSELFGHRKGSFTGAIRDHRGYVEQANGGWLFLDEIASLELSTQAALLRVLENHEVVRVGETKPRRVDIGILSASNVPITSLVHAGKFRLDLWQRLCEMEIELPPLRARRGEITPLINYFLHTMRGGPWRIAPEALQVLAAYGWCAGNVRQLRNCLRTMTISPQDGTLTPASIPARIWAQPQRTTITDQELAIELRNAFRGRFNVTYEMLSHMLLLECVKENFHYRGRCGVREFAVNFNIPPSTASRRLRLLVEQHLISYTELAELIAIDTPITKNAVTQCHNYRSEKTAPADPHVSAYGDGGIVVAKPPWV